MLIREWESHEPYADTAPNSTTARPWPTPRQPRAGPEIPALDASTASTDTDSRIRRAMRRKLNRSHKAAKESTK